MVFRKARREDLASVVALLANDPLGSGRESTGILLDKAYIQAFELIDQDPQQYLLVVENEASKIVGTLQLTFIQNLTYRGGLRAQIEGVRIHEDMRNQGLGKKMIQWAIQYAKNKGAHMVQLTTDKKRPDAIHFYENIGFLSSHIGMKFHF